MEYSEYYLIKPTEIDKIEKLVDKNTFDKEAEKKWTIVVSKNSKIKKSVDIALYFRNHAYTAWEFELFEKGKSIASGRFGDNDEAGIHYEQNFLKGDVKHMASLLGVDAKALEKNLKDEYPDVEVFAELVDFEIAPVTPYDLEKEKEQEEEEEWNNDYFGSSNEYDDDGYGNKGGSYRDDEEDYY